MQLFLTSLVVVNVCFFSRFTFYFFVKHLHFYPIFLITMVVLIDIVEAVEAGAPNGNFRESISSEDDLRSRIFGVFVVKFLPCLPLLGFSNIHKMV